MKSIIRLLKGLLGGSGDSSFAPSLHAGAYGLLLGLAVLFSAPVEAQEYKSYQLMKIEQVPALEYDGKPTMVAQGYTKYKDLKADAKGGSCFVETVRPGDPNGPSRNYTFRWTFNRDLSLIPVDGHVKVTFEIQGVVHDDRWTPAIEMLSAGRATNNTLEVGYLNGYRLWGQTPEEKERARTLYETVFRYKVYPEATVTIRIYGDSTPGYLDVKYVFQGNLAENPPAITVGGNVNSGPGSTGTTTGNTGTTTGNTGTTTGSTGTTTGNTGSTTTPVVPRVNLSGDWIHVGPDAPGRIVQNGTDFTITDERGTVYRPRWETPDTFVIPESGIKGTVSQDGNQITWSEGTIWKRPGADAVSKMTLMADTWKMKTGETVVVPIRLLKGEGLVDMNFSVNYDSTVALAESPVTKGNLLEGGDFEGNPGTPGAVKIGFVPKAGGITAGSGTVAFIKFKAVGVPGSKTGLTLVPDKSTVKGGGPADLATIHGQIVIVDDSGFIPGDVDGNGVVEMNDVLLALKMSVGLIPVNLRADLDKDGQVKAADARLIRERVLTNPHPV